MPPPLWSFSCTTLDTLAPNEKRRELFASFATLPENYTSSEAIRNYELNRPSV